MADVGYGENIELDDLNRDHNNDDENTSLLNDEIRSTSTHQGARPKTRTTSQSYENPSFEVDDIPTVDKRLATFSEREENQDNAWDRIKRKFPKFNSKKPKFTARVDEFNRVKVSLIRRGSKEYNFLGDNDELNDNLPKTITETLGPTAGDVISVNENNNNVDKIKIDELKDEMGGTDISESERNNKQDEINRLENRISERNQMNHRIQERTSLKDRIKSIFKKHGFTVVSVVTAVGVVIGVIVSNLKTGLAKVANGVGNGLKEIGKKLGTLLPGMIGAIASFIFKTAGEVIGFLAKNAWLLIIAVAVAVVDRFKKKNK